MEAVAAAAAPPMYTNSPLALLETPRHKTGNTDSFTKEASYMAISHNSFIRGFNSIYQQAPRINRPDSLDFIAYCLAWHRLVAEHHRYEEEGFFLAIDKAVGQEGVMDAEVQQHAAFHGGLDEFRTYLVGLDGKEDAFSSTRLLEIMDSFSAALYSHLAAELDSLVALSRFHSPERPIDIESMAQAAGKKSLSLDFVLNVLPCFMLNMETVDFEGGSWHSFPPVNAPVLFIMMNVVPLWRRSLWRFASCNASRGYKNLAV